MRARAPTAGARTGSPGSATSASGCAWRWRCGTAPIRSSRSGCSASPTARAITARTSRSTGSTSTARRRIPTSSASTSIPQRAFPYLDLVSTNARRGKQEMEYELLDTGIFDDDRYFDVVVEYAKAAHDDILMLVTAHNRGPDAATLHLLPTLWFRNTWSWGDDVAQADDCARRRTRPAITAARAPAPRARRVAAARRRLGATAVLRERDQQRAAVRRPERVSPTSRTGSTTSSSTAPPTRSTRTVPARSSLPIMCSRSPPARAPRSACASDRRAGTPPRRRSPLGAGFRPGLDARRSEADEFYATVIPSALRRRRSAGDAPGAGGTAVGQAVLRVQRAPLAARARRQPVGPERRRPARCATCRGFTWSRATSSRCRTSGSTRGSLPGTWRSIARRCRWSTSTSPRSRSSCC